MSEARPNSAEPASRAGRLDKVLTDLRTKAPEIQAAAVVSFDGLPMVSDLPAGMDEDRVAAMCAALLSLGERAAEGLGRGMLNQVYIEGDNGTVFLVSADDEAVLVAVAAKGAKVGMMLYEVRLAAQNVAAALRVEDAVQEPVFAEAPAAQAFAETSFVPPTYSEPVYTEPVPAQAEPVATYAPVTSDSSWPSYLPNGSGSVEPPAWS